MAELGSGDFVYYQEHEGGPSQIGLILRTSTNTTVGGEDTHYAEVVPLPDKVLVLLNNCRSFHEPETVDPTTVESSSSSEVTGVKPRNGRK